VTAPSGRRPAATPTAPGEGWRIVRFRPPGVTPYELSNVEVRGVPLWKRCGADAHARRLEDGQSEGQSHAAMAESLAEVLAPLRARTAFHRIHLAGGLVSPAWTAVLESRVGVRVTLGRDGAFDGVAAGLRDLSRGGAVLDLGQTALKAGARVWHLRLGHRVPRPQDALPIDGGTREALLAHAATGLGAVLRLVAAPRRLLVALPAALSADGTPGASSFASLEGDRHFVRDLLAALPLEADHPWQEGRGLVEVLHDAELASLGLRPMAGERVLLLSLGYGPGAAFVERSLG
jgi:hypothetical protein